MKYWRGVCRLFLPKRMDGRNAIIGDVWDFAMDDVAGF